LTGTNPDIYLDKFLVLAPSIVVGSTRKALILRDFDQSSLINFCAPQTPVSDIVTRTCRQAVCSQGRKPYAFEFLGFTHFWFRTREGWYMLSRRTSAKRFRRACRAINEWLRYARNWSKTKEWWLILASKLCGHYQYYGVSGNSRMLKVFRYQVMQMLHKRLNRRSQRNQWSWERFTEYLQHYPLPLPHIVHKFY